MTAQPSPVAAEQNKTAPVEGADNRMLSDYMQTGVRERKDGGVRLYLGKQTEDGHIIVVELISKGRRSLQPVTAWQNTKEAFEEIWGNKKGALKSSRQQKLKIVDTKGLPVMVPRQHRRRHLPLSIV